MSWRERYQIAASSLLFSLAALLFADFLTRPVRETASLFLCGTSIFLGAYFKNVKWEDLGKFWRILPALSSTALIVFSILWTNAEFSISTATGVTTATLLILSYLGFSLPPGTTAIAAPFLLFSLLLPSLLSDLPLFSFLLIVIPIGTCLGELLSLLVNRSSEQQQKISTKRMTEIIELEDVLKRFHRPPTMKEAANEIAKATQEIFKAEESTVVLRDMQANLITSSIGGDSNNSATEPDEKTAELVIKAIGGDQPQFVPHNGRTLLVAPIPSGDTPAGAVVAYPVETQDRDFTLNLSKLFTTQVGIAIEHLFVINALEKENTRDELTGIGNRKHANILLESLEEGDALILLDLDGFKEVNDTLGHPAGDQVLLDLGDHLRACLRDSDSSARLGGDEFLVVAHRAFADPEAVARRILKGWGEKERLTTISAGVALHSNQISPQTTYDRADKALYKAKLAGKNQSLMWQMELLPQG